MLKLTSLNNKIDYATGGNATPEISSKERITQLFINEMQTNGSQGKPLLPSDVIKISRSKHVDLDTSYIFQYTSNIKDLNGKVLFTNNVKDYDIKIYSIVHGEEGVLGEGAFKKAKYMIDLDTGKKIAKSKFKDCSASVIQSDETEMLKALQLVKGLPFVSGGQFAILTSYKKNTQYGVILNDYAETDLDKAIIGKLTIEKKMKFAQELLTGLDSMHKLGVVHRDIKPSNINIIDGVAHLSDLDFATTKLEKGKITQGPPAYMAPEIYKNMIRIFDQFMGGDVYEMGVTLYELFNEKHPWYDDSTEKLNKTSFNFFYKNFLKMNINDFEKRFPEPKKDTIDHLIWEMKHINPKLRPTAEEALNRLNALKNALVNASEPEKDTIDHQVWQYNSSTKKNLLLPDHLIDAPVDSG